MSKKPEQKKVTYSTAIILYLVIGDIILSFVIEITCDNLYGNFIIATA